MDDAPLTITDSHKTPTIHTISENGKQEKGEEEGGDEKQKETQKEKEGEKKAGEENVGKVILNSASSLFATYGSDEEDK
jgi:hypothetical protein